MFKTCAFFKLCDDDDDNNDDNNVSMKSVLVTQNHIFAWLHTAIRPIQTNKDCKTVRSRTNDEDDDDDDDEIKDQGVIRCNHTRVSNSVSSSKHNITK